MQEFSDLWVMSKHLFVVFPSVAAVTQAKSLLYTLRRATVMTDEQQLGRQVNKIRWSTNEDKHREGDYLKVGGKGNESMCNEVTNL